MKVKLLKKLRKNYTVIVIPENNYHDKYCLTYKGKPIENSIGNSYEIKHLVIMTAFYLNYRFCFLNIMIFNM